MKSKNNSQKVVRRKARKYSAKGIGKKKNIGPESDIKSKEKIKTTSTIIITPFDLFQRTIKRANNLINIHKGKKAFEDYHKDAFRASIVLAISALDAYLRTIIIERIMIIISDEKKIVPEELKIKIKQVIDQDKIFDLARKKEFVGEIEKIIKKDFDVKAFQGCKKIHNFMKMIGYKDIFDSVSKSLDKSKPNTESELDEYTNRRHLIAHCGDYDLTQAPPTENNIDKLYALKCISFITNFAEHLNKIIK